MQQVRLAAKPLISSTAEGRYCSRVVRRNAGEVCIYALSLLLLFLSAARSFGVLLTSLQLRCCARSGLLSGPAQLRAARERSIVTSPCSALLAVSLGTPAATPNTSVSSRLASGLPQPFASRSACSHLRFVTRRAAVAERTLLASRSQTHPFTLGQCSRS